jgi:hypothetical protein
VKFSELWRLSGKAYKEVSFQSIFSLRQGSSLPQGGRRDIKQLVANARINNLISKLVTTVFIAIFAAVVFLPLTISGVGQPLPREIAVQGGVAAFLAVVLFLIVFMGLQMSTSFVSSKIVDVLSPLPLSKKDISRIIFLCFIRIFDIPLVAAVIIFLSVYFIIGGSILGGIVSVVAIGVTEIFALALTTVSAQFFYQRVARAGGKSKLQTFMRFGFMLVWLLPTFAAYFIVNFAGQIVQSFAYLSQGFSSISQILVLVYPFSYGFLVSYATFPHGVDSITLSLSIIASFAYVVAGYYVLRWVTWTVRKIGVGGFASGPREVVKDTLIRPQIPWLGIIRKDLRVASRSPSFASLFLLPVVQTIVVAISFSSFSDVGPSTALGILTGISMITLLLPPTLLAIEGLASAYTRHLPMMKRTMVTAKTLLSTVTYVISMIVLSIVAVLLGKSFLFVLTLGLIHAFSVAAAIMLELTILLRKFWKEGFAVGNIYSRVTTYITILIPGYIVAAIPIVSAFTVYFLAPPFFLPVFLATAVSEFAVMVAVVMREK